MISTLGRMLEVRALRGILLRQRGDEDEERTLLGAIGIFKLAIGIFKL